MANLIRMDLRRMFRSPMFFISLAVIGVFNLLLNVGFTAAARFFVPTEVMPPATLTSSIVSPFYLPFFIILMFASLVSFSYADIANGYIKNIAGQLPHKSSTIISKFIVIGLHNLLFLAVGSLTNTLGNLMLSGMGMIHFVNDGMALQAILTLLLKWMLSMALASILMFVTIGIKNKILASIVGVIIGTGSLGLAYMGLSTAADTVFRTDGFDLGEFMPDTLFNAVSVGTNTAVINAVIVSLVCIAIFMTLTVKVFDRSDVK
ncbi:MAG: hypothetical protein IIV05_00550 [Ruminococcus sp.]|nr:hypothetical protein [Ruminococcus sp.]